MVLLRRDVNTGKTCGETPPSSCRWGLSAGVMHPKRKRETGMDFWDNLWNIVWWVLSAAVFFAYLFALFAVISDLFRDQSLSGWAKAAWIIFMVIFPFLTVLVYIIARGKGMNERAIDQSRAARASTEDYIRRVAASPSDEIAKAQDLLNAGSINQEEFEMLKRRALAVA